MKMEYIIRPNGSKEELKRSETLVISVRYLFKIQALVTARTSPIIRIAAGARAVT